jgi:hypothetical protein
MGSKTEMTRKEFLTLTFTLVGTTAAAAACSSDSNNSTGTAGTSGAHGGSGGGAAGTSGGGGTQGAAGTTGAGGTGAAAACTDPLPEMQAPSDHTHHVVIAASTLNMTTAQTINTDVQLAHMHSVTLEPADLAMLKGGGMVMITSSVASAHSHVFTISCH